MGNVREKCICLIRTGYWFNVILLTSAAFLLLVTQALAEQQPAEIAAHDAPAPVIEAAPQALEQDPAPQVKAATSLDFMMDSAPLSLGAPEPGAQPVPEPPPLPGQPLTDVLPESREDTDEVSMLITEKCEEVGEGATSCSRLYSDGHYSRMLSQRSDEGDEFKEQTVIEEFDKDDALLSVRTVRHRVDYNYIEDRKSKEQELFDIIRQTKGEPTTRELMVQKYHLETGKPKAFTWTQYKQVGEEPKAGLVYRASLDYAADGSPERGIADQWEKGQRIATFLNWDRTGDGRAQLHRETWDQWESWLRSVSLQAHLS
ncbi:MAG: hypothetical protein KTQ49_06425 [Candidatus Omnitrophica bacterium]|nr:hypothetical protein [Candidatus Omnitrophota bacterium]